MTGPVNAVETAMLDGLFASTAWAGYTNLWVGLSSTVIAEDGTGATEPTTGAYARVQTAAADWAAAVAGAPSTKANANVISFPQATADWLAGANLVAFALFDAATVGNVVWTGSITVPRPILTDDQAQFQVGDLVLRLGDPGDFA